MHAEFWDKPVLFESAEVTAATRCQHLPLGRFALPGELEEALTDQVVRLSSSPTQINETFSEKKMTLFALAALRLCLNIFQRVESAIKTHVKLYRVL